MSFVIKHLLSQSPKVVLYEKPGILVAKCSYSIINSTSSSINNLYVNPDFRQEKYGSRILKFTESVLKNTYNINNIQLLAHELPHDNLTSFFEKNGYVIQSKHSTETYDDGSNLFNLIPMSKKV
jgi:N-acetylglutamate synthase-like GNAT family acetyltransferase